MGSKYSYFALVYIYFQVTFDFLWFEGLSYCRNKLVWEFRWQCEILLHCFFLFFCGNTVFIFCVSACKCFCFCRICSVKFSLKTKLVILLLIRGVDLYRMDLCIITTHNDLSTGNNFLYPWMKEWWRQLDYWRWALFYLYLRLCYC